MLSTLEGRVSCLRERRGEKGGILPLLEGPDVEVLDAAGLCWMMVSEMMM